MFTGIVEELGEVTGRDGLADAARLTIRGPVVTADAGGLTYWAGVLAAPGQSETTMIISFLSSPEYFAQ